ncbi:4Fe-4S binding protein [uncultured Alistipes sp.]|uniref:4Fe-4S binding protein n=1 Tax=uncultured Alistipes sp. TaxID=538949 RepID=UPI002626CFC1|nr:4Fe-4S binding protein [uncultured Alistipes sp.]
MLRKIRTTLAILCFALITLLFLDFTGTLHAWFGWLAKIQFLPALLALNLGVVALLVLATLLFGRIYCSIICPLGVMQDIIARFGSRGRKRKYRYSYSPAKNWLRYGVLALFIAALVAGIGSFVALIAPYSAYGRIAQNLLAPLYGWGNNLLAYLAERADSYAFYRTEVWIRSLTTLLIAAATLILLVVLAWRNGRTWCNTVCPVGTVLGFFSRFSLFRPVIDTAKCNACGLCARQCKASCIDSKHHAIDYSRCVACMDCLDNCKQGAISYRRRTFGMHPSKAKKPAAAPQDASRRSFLTGTGILLGTGLVRAQEKKVDGGLAVILDKKAPARHTPIVPPGAVSLRHLAQHCTGCQLCVAVCPNGVLRPSSGIMTLMQPESSYERGYCRPECVKCSEVCPAGAIEPITVADKSAIQIGHAVWVRENCVPLTDGVACGNCARHCPTGAITMVPSDPSMADSPQVPVINEERCIGCGACENLCPARPFSAIYVEGHECHRTI